MPATVTNRRVLMFSGGMDSFILKTIYQVPDEDCIFTRMGTEENAEEEILLNQYFPGVKVVDLPLVDFELGNKIIPFRNHFLALMGAQFAPEIMFAFTAGDTTRDKDYVFKAQMEGILNYFSLSEDKVLYPGPYQINMPFKAVTKTEIVRAYLSHGLPSEDLLRKSRSCYAGEMLPCGHCRSCLRKYVALHLNGISCDGWVESIPSIDTLEGFLVESELKGRKSETEDIKKCINTLQQ